MLDSTLERRRARQRALRASLAVTLGGAALGAGCGTAPTETDRSGGGGEDATVDAAGDVGADTPAPGIDSDLPDVSIDTPGPGPDTDLPDVSIDTPGPGPDAMEVGTDTPDPPDVPVACSDEQDGICPEGCTIDEDWDCCYEYDPDWCWYDPATGCGCAVEGPFAPPSVAA